MLCPWSFHHVVKVVDRQRKHFKKTPPQPSPHVLAHGWTHQQLVVLLSWNLIWGLFLDTCMLHTKVSIVYW